MSLAFEPGWTVHTEIFDGPLDLLLYLVKRDGVDLRQVSIARIADAYLVYIGHMREMNLGVAAEYLVMAATLCHLKSLELLPRPPTDTSGDEEPEDPRQQLIERLVDHARFREAADALDDGPMLGRDSFARDPMDLGDTPKPLMSPIDAFGLLDLYHELLRKRDAPEPVHTVGDSGPDIGSCCRRVLRALGGPGGRATLDVVLDGLRTRVERILTFLAVLEMARLGWVGLEQAEHLGAVMLEGRVEAEIDLERVVGRIEVEVS